MTSNSARYIREWRKTPAGKKSLQDQKLREAAKRAAVKDLITRHPAEYQALLTAHLQELLG